MRVPPVRSAAMSGRQNTEGRSSRANQNHSSASSFGSRRPPNIAVSASSGIAMSAWAKNFRQAPTTSPDR